MHQITVREAGSTIYIGYAEESSGDVYKKIFGPLTICRSELTACHEKGQALRVTLTYRANSVNLTFYDRVCFDTFEQALENATKQYEEILRVKGEKAKAA